MSQTIHYDESVIGEFARRLYRRAAAIILWCILLGILGGCMLGAAAASASRGGDGGLIAMFGALGALLGFAIGRERAFMLKLQAQLALCQVQIERNTRAVASTAGYYAQAR